LHFSEFGWNEIEVEVAWFASSSREIFWKDDPQILEVNGRWKWNTLMGIVNDSGREESLP
jgi:hypothetical protein